MTQQASRSDAGGVDAPLPAILQRMQMLFAEYDHYDLTTDILAAWERLLSSEYPEAFFDCTDSIGHLDEQGRFIGDGKPDFTVSFEAQRYAIIGEVKTSVSLGRENLLGIAKQIQSRMSRIFVLRPDPERRVHFLASEQDVLLIVPASAAAGVASFFKANLLTPSGGQHLCLCQFVEESGGGRTLSFSRFPLSGTPDFLRDGFLKVDRRLSGRLNQRLDVASNDYQVQRNHMIAASDGVMSSLGVLARILHAAEEFFGQQTRRNSYTDDWEPPPIQFSIDELLARLRKPPHRCSVGKSVLAEILATVGASAPFIKLDSESGQVQYQVPKRGRYGNFRKEEVVAEVPRKHAEGNLPLLAFHLARGNLRREAAKPLRGSEVHEYPLDLRLRTSEERSRKVR